MHSPAGERFHLVWDGAALSFNAAHGLQATAAPAQLTLFDGHFLGGDAFWRWFNRIKSVTMRRVPLVLTQHDEGGAPIRTWTLVDACPVLAAAAFDDPHPPALTRFVIAHHGVQAAAAKVQECLTGH